MPLQKFHLFSVLTMAIHIINLLHQGCLAKFFPSTFTVWNIIAPFDFPVRNENVGSRSIIIAAGQKEI